VDHLRTFPINRELWLTHGILSRCEDWGTIISLFKKLDDRKWIDRELRGCDIDIDSKANQKPYEIGVLYRFLEGKKIKNILEIGTQFGGTALLWASLVKSRNGRVYCVDKTFKRVIYRDKELASFIIEVEGDSHNKNVIDQISAAIMNNGGSIDFLFIDGDHSYMNVKADFENYFRFVRAGGWIAFHDIIYNKMHPRSIPDVQRFWEEVKANYNHFEITDPNEPLMGIGVLQKPL
jgi:predicted O-methyltransferase YrrM